MKGRTRGNVRDIRTEDLIAMIDYLDQDVRSISPTGAHYLQMAKVALANPHFGGPDLAEPDERYLVDADQ